MRPNCRMGKALLNPYLLAHETNMLGYHARTYCLASLTHHSTIKYCSGLHVSAAGRGSKHKPALTTFRVPERYHASTVAGNRRQRIQGYTTDQSAAKKSEELISKGKLVTTPSRQLKLILPLTSDKRDYERIAFLLHPNQPLSYLQTLVEAELPTTDGHATQKKQPAVRFFTTPHNQPDELASDVRHGNVNKSIQKDATEEKRAEAESSNTPSSPNVLIEENLVRWSASTEIGDLIQDAWKGKQFLVAIENYSPSLIHVSVPSFHDRTHYLRVRLRITSAHIKRLAAIKHECDQLAHRGGRRIALGGFGVMVGWWILVYELTFKTPIGWDVMEPVTYLASLSTLMGGYCWFLYHNREVSYRSALNVTVSRRQKQLYEAKSFDLQRWDALIDEGNALRKEIKKVATEYDVLWDEKADEQDEKVTNALEEVRHRKNGKAKDEELEED